MFIIDRNIVWHSCPYCLCGHHGNHYCICLSPSGSSNSCFVGLCLLLASMFVLVVKATGERNVSMKTRTSSKGK